MSTATKPKSIRIGRRGDTFWRLLLGPDQIVACDERAVTAALDRRTLDRRWLAYFDSYEIHDLFGDVLTIMASSELARGMPEMAMCSGRQTPQSLGCGDGRITPSGEPLVGLTFGAPLTVR